MQSLNAATALLRHIAVIEAAPGRLSAICDAASHVDDWPQVIKAAEPHGLAPLLHHYLKAVDVRLPTQPRLMLAGLVARHRQASKTLSDTLLDIGEIYEQIDLPFVCLKGIALAHIIYPDPSLRPMSDIDILVPAKRAELARTALINNGFSAEQQYSGLSGGRYMRHHHHLPEVTQMRNGMQVTIEIHTDAISGDSPERLRFDSLTQTPLDFRIGESKFQAMNHVDMLTHLIRHALQPCQEIKLGSVCDIVSYASHFHEQLDLERLTDTHPWMINALSLMHYVSELPDSLDTLRPNTTAPDLAGFGMLPLSKVLQVHGYSRDAVQSAMQPPAWWMHAYYGVPACKSITTTRWTRHLPTLLKWLARRLAASLDRSSPASVTAKSEY